MFAVVAVLLLLLLAPSPWNVMGLLVGLVLFVGEIWFWDRRLRGTKFQTGAEALIGRTAIVVAACAPTGRVRLIDAPEVWQARCDPGAHVSETVRVTAREGLTRIVERVPSAEPAEA